MSARFIAHVRLPDGQVEDVDCESAFVEDHVLWLKREHDGEVTVWACYQPHGWTGFRLEAAPQPVTEEQLMRGEKTLNDYRRSLGMPRVSDPDTRITCAVLHRDAEGNTIPCPDAEPKPQHQPEVGDRIHIHTDADGCLPGTVTAMAGLTVVASLDVYDRGFDSYQSVIHDETRTADGSWHWVHDDEDDKVPEPDVPGPVTINLTVQGSILSERDVAEAIRKQTLALVRRYPTAFRR